VYRIELAVSVESDLAVIRTFHRKAIVSAIESQLAAEPSVPTRNRKILANLIPPWDAVPPIWELRVGDYRVFYDVNEDERVVYVRAVRRKPRGKTTGAIP
jgi:mRNA-degrading endonuclease RelE of RelBE toxin-antitoxin system